MIKAEILPKTPLSGGRIFKWCGGCWNQYILIAKYIGLLYECILVEINAFKKEKTNFLTTHPIFSLSSSDTLSNDFQW